jgi:hypothetical protein
MISTLDPESISDTILRRLFQDHTDILPYYLSFDQMFQVLASIVEKSQFARDFAESRGWARILSKLVRVEIPQFLVQGVTPESDFWSGVSLSGVFRLLTQLTVRERLLTFVLRDLLLSHILELQTEIESFGNFLNSMNKKDVVHERIIAFARQRTISINYLRLTELLFFFFGNEAFQQIRVLRPASTFDYACCIVNLLQVHALEAFVEQNIDKFLIDLLFDENRETRLVGGYLILYFVPHLQFSGFPTFPKGKLLKEDLFLTWQESDEKLIERAKRFLMFLLDNTEQIISRINNDKTTPFHSLGSPYFRILDTLARITDTDIVGTLLHIADETLSSKQDFDQTICVHLMQILGRRKVELSAQFVQDRFPTFSMKPDDPVSVLPILESFEPFLAQIEPSPFVVCNFLRYVAFVIPRDRASALRVIEPYLIHFSQVQPTAVEHFVTQHLAVIAWQGFSALLIILEALGKRIPILEHILAALNSGQYFSQNELVCRAFTASTECNEIDPLTFVALLNSPALESDGRRHVWMWLRQRPPEFAAFSAAYGWRGDELGLAEFLFVKRDRAAKQRLLKAAQSDVRAFAVSYEFLKEIAEREIFESNFVSSVWSLDFQDQSEMIVRYLPELFEREGVEQDKAVKPLIDRMRMKFVGDLLGDGAEVSEEDVRPLTGGLSVVRQIPVCPRSLAEDIAAIRKTGDVMKGTELDEFFRMLRE